MTRRSTVTANCVLRLRVLRVEEVVIILQRFYIQEVGKGILKYSAPDNYYRVTECGQL
jgi:hypothetical protein